MPAIEVIINSGSGSVLAGETERSLRQRFIAHGVKANVHLAETGGEIVRLAAKAADGEAEIIVAGGGDGTISAIANEVFRAGKILGVLPLGTLNNFSKDLGIPQDLGGAIKIIAKGDAEKVDLAEVNGRIFINNSSIGLYPQMVRQREEQQRLGYGKWRAAFWSWLRIFRISPFLKVAITLDGKQFQRKTPFVFVGNNEYEMDFYNIGRRPKLNEGKLSLYFLHREGRWGVTVLVFRTVFQRLRQWRDFEAVSTEEITINTRKKRILVAFDGEIAVMESPLRYRTLPNALSVIVPEKR
ncbi:MAG: diacylglycerol kinase family lipid kinase [Acidobacteria bacterium]|nr:diacylglycerol kinase family lipid kinase [Acidobacteriota bacterium]